LRKKEPDSAAFRIFSENFERAFRRVFLYVSRRVRDREVLERIVNEVLEENLDLLMLQGDAPREVARLRASADRLIAQLSDRVESPAPPAELPRNPRLHLLQGVARTSEY
jgi:hypothetical protein